VQRHWTIVWPPRKLTRLLRPPLTVLVLLPPPLQSSFTSPSALRTSAISLRIFRQRQARTRQTLEHLLPPSVLAREGMLKSPTTGQFLCRSLVPARAVLVRGSETTLGSLWPARFKILHGWTVMPLVNGIVTGGSWCSRVFSESVLYCYELWFSGGCCQPNRIYGTLIAMGSPGSCFSHSCLFRSEFSWP
jgi:hypothetical protein